MVYGWLKNIPLKSTAIFFMFSLCEACSFSVMLGYMTDLLHRFGTTWADVGITQGQIVGLNSLAYGCFNFAAGFVIDRIGSLKFFVVATVLQIAVMVFAAFIHNISWMYVTAILTGLASCNRLALKVIVYENSNESNVSEMVNYGLNVPASFGFLIGPSIGGFLALPTVQYQSIFRHNYILEKFPVMLPHLLIALILLITLISSWKVWKFDEQSFEGESLFHNSSDIDRNKETSDKKCLQRIEWSTMKALEFASRRNVIVLTCIRLLQGFTSESSLNLFSLWILTPRSEGGMGFSPKKNGQLKLYASLLLLSMDLVIPIALLKKTGHVRGTSISFIAHSISISLLWLPARFNSTVLEFVLLLFFFVMGRIAMSVISISFSVMLKNVTPVDIRARVLAIDFGVGMMTRAAGQVVFTRMFSWSLSKLKDTDGKVSFPLNEPFAFYAISFFAMLGAFSAIVCGEDAEKPCKTQM